MSSWTVRVGYPKRTGTDADWSGTAHWELRVEARRGRWPTVRLRRVPRAGDRLVDGGLPGTLVRCLACDGDGVLHQPDSAPRGVEPDEGPPWRGRAVGLVASRAGHGAPTPLWTSSRVVGPDVVHRVMETGLAEGRCQDRASRPDDYGVLGLLDAGGDVIGEYAVPDRAAFWWWVGELDLRTTSIGEETP